MQLWLTVSGISGLSAVALGAFGAHGLRDQVSEQALGWWQTAAQYHFIHTLLLLGLGLLLPRAANGTMLSVAGWLSLAGIVLFSGSLYAMALGAPRWFGAITPVGGLAWIAAWALLAWYGAVSQ